jgi:NADH dehydrogenase FAD-containing subunit
VPIYQSGHAVYSQGKVVAKLVNARLKGKKPEEEYMRMVCYAMVSNKEAIMTETSFRYSQYKQKVHTHPQRG